MNDNLKNQEYRVLARKYRPQKFSNLIGQEILVKTLSNAINNNRIAHAYLLTGVRGVGKTTTARLIAMSLNCESRQKDSCEPCGECEFCHSIRGDRNIDVIEIDAASKTGVGDIREIIDNIKYKPVNNRYKIFIIDEVHMLSTSAFNALLKTLEEPPSHVKFIFATTEVKKIPITIISRCQRFDLHRIENTTLNNHLIRICENEKINIDQDALSLIVRASDGSVRDALSLLDQAISSENNKVTAQSIISMLGLADRNKIFDLLDNIFRGDSIKSLEKYNEIYKSGGDVLMIFDEMLKVTHFLTKIKLSPNTSEDINIPESERIKGAMMAEKISISALGQTWQILFKGIQELQFGINLYQHGEMLIIRLIYLYEGPTPEDLISKVDKNIEKISKEYQIYEKNLSNNDKNEIINEKNEPKEDTTKNKLDDILVINSFSQFVDLFYQKKEGMLHTYLYNDVKLISFKEGEIIINTEKINDPNFQRNIAKLVSKWTGRIWKVQISNSNIGKTLYEENLLDQQNQIENMKNDEEIKRILEKYSEVKIHSITNISETSDEKNTGNLNKKTKEQS